MSSTITIIEAEYGAPDSMPVGTVCKVIECWRPYDGEVYEGRMADLITAGLVTADQFPPEGKWHVSFLAGAPMLKRRCRADETFRRVSRTHRDEGFFRVAVGLPREVIAARRQAKKDRMQEEREEAAAKERAEELRDAQRRLSDIPETEREFRLKTIDLMRTMVRIHLETPFEGSDRHGFTLDEDAQEDLYLSFDAIAEAIMRAPVKCDRAKQTRIVSELQARIVAAGGGVAGKVAALTRPNPALLEGETT